MDGVIHTYGTDTTTDTSIASTLATLFRNLNSTSGATVHFAALWNDNIKPTFTVSNTSANESQNLTINISASDNGTGLHAQAYSCNGGSTWSATASCNM